MYLLHLIKSFFHIIIELYILETRNSSYFTFINIKNRKKQLPFVANFIHFKYLQLYLAYIMY